MNRPPRLAWLPPVCLNAVLGVLAIVPFFALALFLRNFPLHDLGLTRREPTENDGILGWVILLVPLGGTSLGIWFLSNYLVRNTTRARALPARRYWLLSTAVVCLPFLLGTGWAALGRLWPHLP
ncbi:hypothetical protein RM780_02315 [Streptomyces sp. DSM 44917]|uniref:Cardiolipin synthase N-terminal domain-containing protein n=1 Tax=Streptomyces boetiae TaxID=3075541 RepID=A0ABU2L3H8_9ACTN|nr:hypothetical protein [Streptomyces sp. DSM 44917]MDT0305798.1 hypothetical protein [Streptomyces sp. DSM 44917]